MPSIQAGPGFNRWLIPPAALAIHLSIGQAYAFSVFNLPLTKLIGITASAPGDWTLAQVGWIFAVAIVVLGLSAAVFGPWLERVGPRTSGLTAAGCWSAGFLVAALGVATHRLWLIILGYGVIGGCGLGLGYITPVSTLIKWFPDRRGMATGMAIMGFGGGAMIAAPLSTTLMKHFASTRDVGVAPTFVLLGIGYGILMVTGALIFRLPPMGFRPSGWAPSATTATTASHSVTPSAAIKTRPFWLLWVVLCFNVTAGIGVLGQASAMIQEVFRGRVTAVAAGGFVGLLSLFNMVGRFFWSSLSDRIGRRITYACFFGIGLCLYAAVPLTGSIGSVALFVACFAIILTMYGGGFATIPAYLSDLFGTRFVGAIHGRLLTAWSTAGILGPALVNYIRQFQVNRGVPAAQAYNVTMFLMALLLAVGFLANWAVRPVDQRYLVPDPIPAPTDPSAAAPTAPATGPTLSLGLAWAAVGIPLLWGVATTVLRATALFAKP